MEEGLKEWKSQGWGNGCEGLSSGAMSSLHLQSINAPTGSSTVGVQGASNNQKGGDMKGVRGIC